MREHKSYSFLFIVLFTLFFQFIETYSQGTGTATGRILDRQSGAPIMNADVYLANTTLGCATNKAGRYTIENIPPGNYVLVISMMGYQRVQLSLTIEANKTTKENINLQKALIKMPEVNVFTEDREELLNTFREKLFGLSPNSEQCVIENPDVVFLSLDDDDNLVAKSDSFVTIINHGLGYRIKFLIQKFVWDTGLDIGSYQIYPRFEQLESGDSLQMKQWVENRADAYLGSFRHFLYCVANDSMNYANYTVYHGNVAEFNVNKKEPVYRKDWDVTFNEEFAKLCLKDHYLVENGYLSHLQGLKLKLNKNCVIIASDCLMISYSGILLNPNVVQLSGYWANQRMADALPFDYKLSK